MTQLSANHGSPVVVPDVGDHLALVVDVPGHGGGVVVDQHLHNPLHHHGSSRHGISGIG